MKTVRIAALMILIACFLLGPITEVMAYRSTISSQVHITIRAKPAEILVQDENLNDCYEAQIEQNPTTMPKVNVEQVKIAGEESTRYTICEEI